MQGQDRKMRMKMGSQCKSFAAGGGRHMWPPTPFKNPSRVRPRK